MIKTSSPGRICLFGEHQDYLQLPVITAAIDLDITIRGEPRNDNIFKLDLPDINENLTFKIPPDGVELKYSLERDYFRSVYNLLLRNGANFNRGWECDVTGDIPINSGTASSSALCVAWTKFLIKINTNNDPKYRLKEFVGRIAYLAEVEEFGEPGGMMDHYASSYKGVLYQEFTSPVKLLKLPVKMGTFVLGDSLEPKNTLGILKRVKTVLLEAVDKIIVENPAFNIKSTTLADLPLYKSIINESQMRILKGTILNRDITTQAAKILNNESFDVQIFKNLLNEHQKILSQSLRISTPKIDKMLKVAEKEGAFGGKINGSGGGGCMFVYAPENTTAIASAIEKVGAKAYIVNVEI